MGQAVARDDNFLGLDPSMKGPFMMSGIFHVVIFLLTVIGIPFVIKQPVDVAMPINVEIVDVDKITQTNKPPKPVERTEDKKEDKPPPKLEKPSPPDIQPTPPQISELAPPDVPKPPEAKPVPKTPPKKPPPKPVEKKPDKPKPDFQSLLKNLTPDKKTDAEPQKDFSDVLSAAEQVQTANLSDKLTVSEIDALRHQLSQCWNVMSGAKYAEDLVIQVRVVVNPDRTVQQAVILDSGRYNRESNFRAAAEAAVRAFYNPKCIPLALPPDKYDEWKTTIITFDPREML